MNNKEQIAEATFRTYEGESIDLWVFRWDGELVQYHVNKLSKTYRWVFPLEMTMEEAEELNAYTIRKLEELYGTHDQESGD